MLNKIMSFSNKFILGQISTQDFIGKSLEQLILTQKPKNIVEIGTWNGLGSTKIILDSLKVSSSMSNFYSLEIDKRMFYLARWNLRKYGSQDNFHLLRGRVIEVSDLDSRNLSINESRWFEIDKKQLENAPLILDKLPKKIDLLVCDGGEFSTFREFVVLENRILRHGYVILDDTKVRKSRKIIELVESGNLPYKILFKSEERNGTAILQKL